MPMYDKHFWESKKWWMATISSLIAIANYFFSWGIDPAAIWTIILPILTYVLGQAFVDAARKRDE